MESSLAILFLIACSSSFINGQLIKYTWDKLQPDSEMVPDFDDSDFEASIVSNKERSLSDISDKEIERIIDSKSDSVGQSSDDDRDEEELESESEEEERTDCFSPLIRALAQRREESLREKRSIISKNKPCIKVSKYQN